MKYLFGFWGIGNDAINYLAGIVTIVVPLVSVITYIYKRLMQSRKSKVPPPLGMGSNEYVTYTDSYVFARFSLSPDAKKKYGFRHFAKRYIMDSSPQFHFVLGDSGAGKSAFLINLYVYLKTKAHMKEKQILYMTLRENDTLARIAQISNPQTTVLLLDAFDEANEAYHDSSAFLEEVENVSRRLWKVVIASRRVFFDSTLEEPSYIKVVGVASADDVPYIRHYIQLFSRWDTLVFLYKKFGFAPKKLREAMDTINIAPDMLSRPLLMSFIEDIINEEIIEKNLHSIYELIFEKWVKREIVYLTKTSGDDSEDIRKEQESNFTSFVYEVAVLIYMNSNVYRGWYVTKDELIRLSETYGKLIMKNKRERSLFSRNSIDKFFFSHMSIFEYCLAKNITRLNNFLFEANLDTLYQLLLESGVQKTVQPNHSSVFYISNMSYADDDVFDNQMRTVYEKNARHLGYDKEFPVAIDINPFFFRESGRRRRMSFSIQDAYQTHTTLILMNDRLGGSNKAGRENEVFDFCIKKTICILIVSTKELPTLQSVQTIEAFGLYWHRTTERLHKSERFTTFQKAIGYVHNYLENRHFSSMNDTQACVVRIRSISYERVGTSEKPIPVRYLGE